MLHKQLLKGPRAHAWCTLMVVLSIQLIHPAVAARGIGTTSTPTDTPGPNTECTAENRPVVRMGTPNSGPPGTTVSLTGSFRTGSEMRAQCCWRNAAGRAYSCYQEATIGITRFAPAIHCAAPNLASAFSGVPAPRIGDRVSVSVHVWHVDATETHARHGLCWSWSQTSAAFTYTSPDVATSPPTTPEPPATTTPPPTAAPVSPFRFETCELNASLDTHPYPHGGHFEQLPSNGYCPCPASMQNCSSYRIVVNSGIDMDALIVWAETADGERVGRWDIGLSAGSYDMYEHASGSAGQPCPGAPNSTIENNQLLNGYAHTIRWFPPTTAVGNITFNGMWQTSSSSRPGTYHFHPATLELNSHPACALTAEPTQPPPTPTVSTTTMQPMTCARNCGQAVRGGGTCRANGRCTSCNSNRVLQSGRCYQSLSCKGRRIQTGSTAGSGCRCLQDQCHWCTRSAAGDICRVVSGLLR